MQADKVEWVEVEGDAGSLRVSCRIRRSARARRMNLRVKADGEVVLTLPRRCPEREGIAFLQTNVAWLQRKLAEPVVNQSLAKHFRNGAMVAVDDGLRSVCIISEAGPGRVGWSLETAGELHLRIDSQGAVDPQLLHIFRAVASEWLPSHVQRLGKDVGERVSGVRVGNQKSRWGSCSAQRTISLNWRLVLLPPELRDYVILHELAHLRHMNHSPAFWNRLNKLDSSAGLHDRDLGKAGKRLMPLGRG